MTAPLFAGKTKHDHDWADVAGWSIDQLTAHWFEHHNNMDADCGHGRLTFTGIRDSFESVQDALRQHQALHLLRLDDTRPPQELLDPLFRAVDESW